MIKILRPAPPDTWLKSKPLKEAREAIETIVALSGRAKSEAFTAHWNKKEFRKALWDMQHRKCCYCERLRDLMRESDIEHFRPKAEIDGDGAHPGYWWLAYEWENLFFSCRMCNQDYKRNFFPVAAGSARAAGPGQPLEAANRLLLHPCDDDPENELMWIWHQKPEPIPAGKALAPTTYLVFVHGTTDRGNMTRTTLGLNREGLLEERSATVQTMQIVIEKAKAGKYLGNDNILAGAIADIRQQTSHDKPFLGLRRFMIRQAGLDEYLETSVYAPAVSPTVAAPPSAGVAAAPTQVRRRARRPSS
jgi:uncharacterized protein (TIGR02646 family)